MEQKAWNAKRVGMVLLALVMAASALLFATGCSSQSNQKESSDPITLLGACHRMSPLEAMLFMRVSGTCPFATKISISFFVARMKFEISRG